MADETEKMSLRDFLSRMREDERLNLLLAEIEGRVCEPSDELVRQTSAKIRESIQEFDDAASDSTKIDKNNFSESAPIEKHEWQEFRAAAASDGEEKPRALREIAGRKTPLGDAKRGTSKCSFYAIEDRVFVGFDHGQAPPRIIFPGLAAETYALSPRADADDHYEIVGIKAADVAQFLALRRKPRW